jgi:hypothetical protein
MIDVQYTRVLYSLSNRLRLACKIREQTYVAANNVAVFSSFLFADFILRSIDVFLLSTVKRPKFGTLSGKNIFFLLIFFS